MYGLLALLFSLGLAIAALLSVQNATAVSLQLFLWRSVPLPVGLVIIFGLGLGVVMVAISKPLWTRSRLPLGRRRSP